MHDNDQAPTADQLETLDRLRDATLVEGATHDDEEAFWGAMLGLERWYLVCAADEGAVDGSAPPSLITLKDGEGKVLAPVYSSGERASRGFGKLATIAGASEGYAVMDLPTRDAVAYLCAIARETPFVLLDNVPGELKAYGNATRTVPGWYDHHVGPCPVECFGLLAGLAGETSQAAAFLASYRCALSADALYVVRAHSGDLAIANEQGKAFLPVFTSEAIAERQASGMGDVTLQAVAPAQIAPTDAKIREQVGEEYIGAVIDPGVSTLIVDAGLWERAERSLA
ncbi:MAG: hypothetical protein AAGH64_00630 [Planctomycetota bacterium]